MQGRKKFRDEKELLFSLSAHVPEHNFYRRLKQQLDLSFLYELTAPGDCRQCSSKPTCAPKTRCRKITRTAYDEQYLRAYARQHSRQGKRMKKLRQRTVEPVFGSLVHHYGLSRVSVLGKSGAHKVMLMAAAALNIRKYMRNMPKKSVSMATAMEREQPHTHIFSYWLTPAAYPQSKRGALCAYSE